MSDYTEQKEKVLQTAQRLSELGYFGTKSGSAGNVSMLIEGTPYAAVTPSGLPYPEMVVENIAIVDMEGNRIEGDLEPSVETGMHLACYKNRKDVNAVIHTHQLYASTFALINHDIPALFDEVVVAIGNKIEIVPYGLSGSDDLLNNVVSKLVNRCHCYILQNHGALAIGKNLDKAFTYIELMEKVCTVYSRALATGLEVTTLDEMLSTALHSITTSSQDMEIARKESLEQAAN